MAELGKFNTLKVVKKVDFGIYLDGGEYGEILLPKRYAPSHLEPGDDIDVFVYLDGEERTIATTEKPLAQVGEFAFLKVRSVEKSGAFLDWGIMKDIMVPFSEQRVKMEAGRSYLVYIYVDKLTDRISASMKLEKFLDKTQPDYQLNEQVDIIIWNYTDIGYKAIINGKHQGVLYKSDTFKKLLPGQRMVAYIKKIREDGKIDLILDKPGYQKIEGIAGVILDKLNQNNGKLPFTDKTDPAIIYREFGVSKKVFKQALGQLYKQKLIKITDTGVELP